MTEQFLTTVFERLGWAGLCLVALYFLARKLADQYDARAAQYESRIIALEKHAVDCEAEKISMRNTIITIQQDIIKDYQRREAQ